MNMEKINTGKLFLVSALVMLIIGLLLGVLASQVYILPGFLKESIGFISLRPMHVSSVMFWILLGATGCIYSALPLITKEQIPFKVARVQWFLWLVAIAGIFYSYFNKKFGGREYWEFEPAWSLPIALAWILFMINYIRIARAVKQWPVYMWMWMTGIIFFLFSFTENYLWVFPYFRENFITDMTIQWKVNGSLVGAWNQILYGTAFFLMDRISGNRNVGSQKLAFGMYFLGLFNLMFNWGHHIYTLPTAGYVRYLGYAVSMTEWIIFARIIYTWRKSLTEARKNYHYFPYRFLMAADIWVFINITQALLMSVPAINIYTHGTHVTVAHAMGTTIGINSMILLAACFEFFGGKCVSFNHPGKTLNRAFWTVQGSLLVFWFALTVAGIQKGIWQMSAQQIPFKSMMNGLLPWFVLFAIAGIILMCSLSVIAVILVRAYIRCEIKQVSARIGFHHKYSINIQPRTHGKII
jgi:nitric oxide reductase subunit B